MQDTQSFTAPKAVSPIVVTANIQTVVEPINGLNDLIAVGNRLNQITSTETGATITNLTANVGKLASNELNYNDNQFVVGDIAAILVAVSMLAARRGILADDIYDAVQQHVGTVVGSAASERIAETLDDIGLTSSFATSLAS